MGNIPAKYPFYRGTIEFYSFIPFALLSSKAGFGEFLDSSVFVF
jgi:hypothetical protein